MWQQTEKKIRQALRALLKWLGENLPYSFKYPEKEHELRVIQAVFKDFSV